MPLVKKSDAMSLIRDLKFKYVFLNTVHVLEFKLYCCLIVFGLFHNTILNS
jgi:hypothetical protein